MSNFEKLTGLGIELKRSSGSVKVKCPKCSHLRKHRADPCLSVNIDSGVYNCHNCDFKGSVGFNDRPQKVFVRPVWQNNTNLSEALVKWFSSRGISQQTLITAKIGEGLEYMPQKKAEVNTVQFHYFRGEELINTKFRTHLKDFKMVKDAELIFYNLNGISGKKEALIVEGEADCLSFIEAGIEHVVSVPNGASKGSQKLEYLDNCWSDFEDKEKIYIGTDNDEAGISLRNELIRRLGDDRCYIVAYGDCKDGNEYMVKHGKTSLPGLIEAATPVPIEGIFTISDLGKEIDELYQHGLPRGEVIGQRLFDEHLSFLQGQLCTVTGIPNHGKSDFVDHICERLAVRHKWKTAYFSPENFPIALHVSKISEKIIGKPFEGADRMSREELDQARAFMNDHFFFIRPSDESFTLDNILSVAKKLIRQKGINALVIDPWNTLEHQVPFGMSETSHINSLLAKLTSFIQRNNVLGFLIAHPTKMKKDKHTRKYEVPTLYDISGSANFFNKTFNGFCVYRDFSKKTTTVFIQKVKFRHMGQVGQVEFEYDLFNGRYKVIGTEYDRRNHLLGEVEEVQPAMTANTNFYEPVREEESNGDELPF